MEIERIYTTKSAATLLDVHQKTIQRLCRKKKVNAHKKLGKWFILHSDLLTFIKS